MDSLDIIFGYRKLSLANIFSRADAERKKVRDATGIAGYLNLKSDVNDLERLFVGMIEGYLTTHARVFMGLNRQDAEDYGKRAAVFVTRGERVWQELVRETKDIIVVKTGLVLAGNIWSNLSLLAMSGVPLKEIVQHHLVALKGATAYQIDTAELAQLQAQIDTGYTLGNEDEIKRRVVRLKDALARNPVKELIDAGLMPTIVEDIAADEDPFSYKSAFVRKTEGIANKIHPKVLAAGRVVYMAHDTKMYQGLSRITQLSDFVARYTLYQHMVSRKTNPLDKETAIQEASDAFVNYDIPMHRGMQYTDDMGLTMFTKYFMRIQRVLLKVARENPARVMTTLLLGNFMDLGPIVLDGSGLTRIGNNPLEWGAFQLPGTLDELATLNSAMALIK
jgi:hypothetical protein